MTIQPIGSYDSNAYGTNSAQQKPPAPQSSQDQPQDTVHLSSQAKASLDVDHDGDSH